MGKQTMGTPFHSFPYRVDNKVYRIQVRFPSPPPLPAKEHLSLSFPCGMPS